MRCFIVLLILCPLLLQAEPAAAGANRFILHALSDSELAANRAGGTISIRFEERAGDDRIALTGIDNDVARSFFGIQTIVLESGASSATEAATFVAITATLKNVSLRPSF